MSHFHAATPDAFAHVAPGDNGACRCAAHTAPGTRQADACAYECYLCERTRILQARVDQRGDPRPLAGEEKKIKEEKRVASLVRGGCDCGSYGPRALKAFAKAG